jgi:hypothetical protein
VDGGRGTGDLGCTRMHSKLILLFQYARDQSVGSNMVRAVCCGRGYAGPKQCITPSVPALCMHAEV